METNIFSKKVLSKFKPVFDRIVEINRKELDNSNRGTQRQAVNYFLLIFVLSLPGLIVWLLIELFL